MVLHLPNTELLRGKEVDQKDGVASLWIVVPRKPGQRCLLHVGVLSLNSSLPLRDTGHA
jgi:hypothetical protein